MNLRVVLALLVVLPAFARGQAPKETDWEPALVSGSAPDCPEHAGKRTSYSATARIGTISASIVGRAIRGADKSCSRDARIVLSGREEKTVSLPISHALEFEIADFSPNGRTLLLTLDKEVGPPYDQTRDVEVAVVRVDHPEVRFVNAWDVFGWGKCEATVEPQGFTSDGKVLLSARPGTGQPEIRHDCVTDQGLYVTDLKGKPVRLPDDTKVPRFGKVIAEEHQACKTDPDIVEACFTVHGRLLAANGSPSLRIWRTGTNRILGVEDEYPLPAELDNYDLLNGAAWGDFEVCPFTKDKPGWMRRVCVESAKRITYEKY